MLITIIESHIDFTVIDQKFKYILSFSFPVKYLGAQRNLNLTLFFYSFKNNCPVDLFFLFYRAHLLFKKCLKSSQNLDALK